ncbi:hypothetical protein [Motiliproteus sp. MSK22-1]|uniref:hypothetical protein n=1 Tax=Motiliproteus sp. MSK22-1 TaxID=1897630 RepID=UPI000977ECA8|nr:hypothetical protein [Motiliproteus sp. MSK22-1]OMH28028.1 hypothetical protein BGP75_21910 [Motiliproteus sp. MSK22-1]
MHFYRSIGICWLVLICFTGCNGQTKAGEDWLKVCPAEQFCFRYPPELKQSPQLIIDSIAGLYTSEDLQLSYDFGAYSSNFSELTSPDIQDITVDGREGKVFISGKIMALHIPAVSSQLRFSMQLLFRDDIDPKLGRKIFESVKFTPVQQ